MQRRDFTLTGISTIGALVLLATTHQIVYYKQ